MDRERAAAIFAPAAREALEAFPLEPGELELVSMSENATFRVTDRADGAAYVLRLHRPGYHTDAELNSERVWTRALGEAGLAVPVPLQARDGRDYVTVAVPGLGQRRQAGMTRWIEGQVLAETMREVDDIEVLERWFTQLGEIAARVHNQSSEWTPPAGFERPALDAEGLMGEAPFWGRFWDHPILSPSEREAFLTAREKIRDALVRHGRPRATYGVIHADLHPGNILVEADTLSVIDFDDCAFGWHQYEIAIALLRYRKLQRFGDIENAFLTGYRSLRALSPADAALIPMFLLIRQLAVIGWLHQRPEIEASQFLMETKADVRAECEAFIAPC